MITNALDLQTLFRFHQFIWKDAFYFAFLILLAAILIWNLLQGSKKQATLFFPAAGRVKLLAGSGKSWLLMFSKVLHILGIVFIIISLARPQEANTRTKKNVEGIDIVIVLDVSDSMLIEDMSPLNRLEAAKEVIRKFIEKRNSDRIGIVVFAGEAFTLVPPTLDYPLILQRVKDITTAANAKIKDGTALGVALANGSSRLKDSTAKSRVMIFLTDGENNSGTIDPETGLAIAKGYEIKIYSIGLGKDGPTRIPIYTRDMFGNARKIYQPFESTVNDDLLGRMASETGGKYFRATRENSLEGVFSEIDQLETSKVDVNQYTQYAEMFPPFVKMAFLFLILSMILQRLVLRRMIA